MNATCRICNHPGPHTEQPLRERMFGSLEPFPYFICAGCGTIQIETVPDDLGRHYPPHYYSMTSVDARPTAEMSPLKLKLKQARADQVLGRRSLAGALASRLFKDYFEYPWDWFRMARVGTASRILDVGCGSGHLLHALHWQGFRHVTGIDAFLGEESQLPGLQILRREIAQMDGTFDLIMFHHSLEHMPDPISALRHAARLCSPTGAVLVRLPITGTFAWREYQDLWVQLDAPRHLFIPTQHAVEVAGKAADLRLDAVEYDSGPLQFFGSELYRKDLPLFQPDGTKTGDKLKLFPREVMDDYRARAAALNAKADGDQACFYFRKAA